MISLVKLSKYIAVGLFICLSGCSSDGTNSASGVDTNVPSNVAELAAMPVADYELLFIGNSHSSSNGLPNLVGKLIESAEPGKTTNAGLAPGYWFLDERVNDGVTLETIEARQWSHVFLQAQKYSTTGRYSYSTDAAQDWVNKVKSENAIPVLFPEWPRYKNKEEGQRIYELHQLIASKEAACVAPVGPVWDAFIARHPNIKLHAADGNHSNVKGALLTAFVFFQIITEKPANVLAYIPELGVNEETQAKLKAVALDFHNIHMPCP